LSAGHRLYRPGSTVVHRLPAQAKIVAALAFVIAVVATPFDAYPAFAAHAALVVLALAVAGVPAAVAGRHLLIELPFVAFALLLPFVATGPQVDVAGLSLSVSGLEAAWNLLAKATLGVSASLVLAATTSPQALLQGLVRLRTPAVLVSILAFMVRYADVIGEELVRMRTARESRGFAARGPRAWPVIARGAGALFIRSYERGERVHLAMISRGYAGNLPIGGERSATARDLAVGTAVLSRRSCRRRARAARRGGRCGGWSPRRDASGPSEAPVRARR
jgi:cobalt/nickel transport system permease protein